MTHDAPPAGPRAGRPEQGGPSDRAGLIATALGAGLVAMLAILVAAAHDGLGPPPSIPAWLPLGIAYGAPAVIGWLGATSGRRALLAAAGAAYVPLAVLAFSGVTLPFLLPALLYLRAAAGSSLSSEAAPPAPHPPRRRLAFLAASAVSAPVVVWIVLATGFVGVVGLVVVAGLAQAFVPSRPRSLTGPVIATRGQGPRLVDGLLTAAIVTLVLGASASALATTTERCWIRIDTAAGPRFREVPSANSIHLDSGATAGGCDSGIYTAGGLALEMALVGSAVLLAGSASHGTRVRTSTPPLAGPYSEH